MIKMIAVDLDGTLFTSAKTIDKKTKQALIDAQKKGVYVGFATGRVHSNIIELGKQLEFDKHGHAFNCGLNGQELYDYQTKEYTYGKTLSGKEAMDIQNYGMKLGFYTLAFVDNNWYVRAHLLAYVVRQLNKWYRAIRYREGYKSEDSEYIHISKSIEYDKGVVKVVFANKGRKLWKKGEEIRNHLKDYNVMFINKNWLEIMPKNVGKGNGILEIAEKYGINKDEILVFGDGENDIDMLEAVTYGIAMGNALETVKEHAYEVCDDNNHAGIYKTLKKYGVI